MLVQGRLCLSFGEPIGSSTGHMCYYAKLVQKWMASAYVEGCVSRGVAVGVLVTCSVHGCRFTVQLRFMVQQ